MRRLLDERWRAPVPSCPASSERGLLRRPAVTGRRGVRSRRPMTLLELLVALGILMFVLALTVPRIGRLPARLRAERGVSAVRSAISEAALSARSTGRTVRLRLDLDDGGSRWLMTYGASDRLAEDILGHFTLSHPNESGGLGAIDDSGEFPGGHFLPDQREFKLPRDLSWGTEFAGELEAPVDGEIAFVFHPGGEAGGPELPFTVGKRSYVVTVERLTGRPLVREVSE